MKKIDDIEVGQTITLYNTENNSNKWYSVKIKQINITNYHSRYCLILSWGKIGKKGRTKKTELYSLLGSKNHAVEILNKKLQKGYKTKKEKPISAKKAEKVQDKVPDRYKRFIAIMEQDD